MLLLESCMLFLPLAIVVPLAQTLGGVMTNFSGLHIDLVSTRSNLA